MAYNSNEDIDKLLKDGKVLNKHLYNYATQKLKTDKSHYADIPVGKERVDSTLQDLTELKKVVDK